MYVIQRWQIYDTKIPLLDLFNTSNSFAWEKIWKMEKSCNFNAQDFKLEYLL